jgi:hypothetical protein
MEGRKGRKEYVSQELVHGRVMEGGEGGEGGEGYERHAAWWSASLRS